MSLVDSYRTYYTMLLEHGEYANPRGQPTRELLDQSFSFRPGMIVNRDGGNNAIGFVELLQFIEGVFNRDVIAKVAPRARLDLFSPQSAYGPRVREQLEDVLDQFVGDQMTRRAVLNIGHHDEVRRLAPCTETIQFFVRNHMLRTIVNMRASDAIWGMPYDIIQFGGIAQMMTHLIEPKIGWTLDYGIVTVHAASAHVYETTVVMPTAFTEMYGFNLPYFSRLIDYQRWAAEKMDEIIAMPKWDPHWLVETFNIEVEP